ncbi:cadherin-related family member 2-like [Megalops cyprinoides]|uniref:cadherin-related family member 2-like n=1 Tax=Megalops cyprinoides TaxID=118141 RepID=UPI0018656419|nr:cadherin-related family member 2-like [Megalops cyprinoides]
MTRGVQGDGFISYTGKLTAKPAEVQNHSSPTDDELRLRRSQGHYAFTILATDAENDPLTYSIIGENRFYFSVNPTTGDVTVKSPLDREVRKTLIVILDDANDNRPIFVDAPFNKDVLENAAVDTVLFQVTARDADYGLASLVSYKIDDVVPNDGMSLFSISERTGEVKLIGSLNYTSKSTFYQLKINASDGGGPLLDSHVLQSSSAFAFITVIDVPDLPPQFLNLPYSTTVNEQTAVGFSVFQVRAIDPDTGVHGKILFSIKNSNAPDLFEIDKESGIISVKTMFDREDLLHVDAIVKLQVMASETKPNIHGDISNTTADVQLNIGDINDNKPQFYSCEPACNFSAEAWQFTGSINEHSSVGVPVGGLNILARDLDEGVNARFELHLQGPDKDAFYVSPPSATLSSPVQILIKNPSDVDYEKKQTMILEVVAMDTFKTEDCCSTATVTIQIKDINDNSPAFKNETYYLEVDEHSRTGKIVATITATDPDTEDVGKISYRLLPESILKYFDVHPKTGRIKVKDSGLLDREIRAVYSATLQATDNAKNVGTTVLEITLRDINDETPSMARDSYIDFVKEVSGAELQLQIQAFDGDEPGTNNSKIQYRIERSNFSGNFTINANTGLLKNKGPLDREAIDPSANGVIHLNVTAFDMGHPSLSSWVTVTINVEDINDNTPKFKSPSYEFFVKESEKGAFVGSVFARDLDQTEMNNRISFRIADGSFGNFIIIAYFEGKDQGYMGNITVDPDVELNYERHRKSYNLKVEATDLGQKIDVITVMVHVIDVNDERPTLPDVVMMNIKENTTGLGEVGRVVGADLDTSHSLVYNLLTTTCRCSGVVGPCEEEWFRLEATGAVVMNEEFVIDYEMCDQVIMEVQAVDVFTEKGENHSIPGKLVINIDDINDNIPQFIISDTMALIAATKATVHIMEIVQESQEERASAVTLLGAYFVYPNGSAVNSDNVERILQEDLYYANVLRQYGLTYIVMKVFDPVLFVLIGLVASLFIVLIVMMMSLVYTQRSYRRKLKAAKAMNSAAMVSAENHKGHRPVVPGTNKYSVEGANPVLNMNIDITTDLGFDEEGSNADRISVNSLEIDMNMTEKDTVPMMMIEEEDEENTSDPRYIEPLGEALAQRDMTKGPGEMQGVVNPALNTTDL